MKLATKDKQAPMNPLEVLQQAKEAVAVFETSHEKVFEIHRALTEAVSVAEETVKTWCKQNQSNLSTDRYIAEFVQGKSRWYDPTETTTILTAHKIPEATINLVVTRTETVEVDMAKLKQVAKLHGLDLKTFAPAYHEEVTQNRCVIKEKTEE